MTKDNIFLPNGYYKTLLEDYGGPDNPLARQELFGQFVNLQSGAIYWAFNREIHVGKVDFIKGHTVLVGQDFNIDNMCNIYVQRIDNVYRVFQENKLTHRNANTDDASIKICEDLEGINKKIIPDSTGRSRKSSSRTSESDIQIMESYGLEVVSTRNPLIRDRQNTVNIAFKKNKIIIDESCKELIKEIENLSSRDEEGNVAHLSVCLGYIIYKYDPIRRNYGKSQSIQL